MCRAACAASLTKLAKEAGEASKDTTFSQYAAAVLNSLVYLLKDSLERLQDIHNIEASMADEASWKALPPRLSPDAVVPLSSCYTLACHGVCLVKVLRTSSQLQCKFCCSYSLATG